MQNALLDDPDLWGRPIDKFRPLCAYMLPLVEPQQKAALIAMAIELNNEVLAGTITAALAIGKWATLFKEIEKDIEASSNRHYRRSLLEIKVAPIYLEPIDLARIPNKYAYDQVMSWFRPLPKEHGLTNIGVAKHYGRGLLCFGKTGAGKTRSVLARLIDLFVYKNIDFIAEPSLRLYSNIVSYARSDPDSVEDLVMNLIKTPILLIDDICKIKLTPRFGQELYRVIEQRTNRYSPIITTTQLTGDSLIDKWTGKDEGMRDIAEAIVRRLREFCEPINFDYHGDKPRIKMTLC